MAGNDLRAKLVIEAGTEGAGKIDALAGSLEAIASEAGEAAPKFNELAQSLREMAQQDAAIEDFARLKRETEAAASAMGAASAQVDKLAAELEAAGQAARQAGLAQAQAARELDAARQWQQQLKEAVAQTRAELTAERQALKDAGADSALYAERVHDAQVQLVALKGEQQQAAQAVRLLAAAQKESEAATRNAAGLQKQLTSDYERAVTSASRLSGALGRSSQALDEARSAMQAAGVDTQGLSAQQAELKARLQQAQQQAQQYTDVVAQMRSETQNLAPALEATFKQLGMRGVRQITAEIEQLQATMRGLSSQKLLPEDAQRATALLTQRIEALRAEAKGAAPAVAGLGQSADGAGNALARAGHKMAAWSAGLVGLVQLKQVAASILETGSAFEQLEGRLTSILGSADAARGAFVMLQELAQQTPFDVQGLTEAYAKLSAFGLNPTREQMMAMADTAATLGGGTETLAGVTLALGQAWTKGKLQGEEMLQLAERGVPAWDLLAQATGKNVQELQALATAGQLGRKEITLLIEAMGQKNAGASAEQMKTFAGAVASAKDALQTLFKAMGQAGEISAQGMQRVQAALDKQRATIEGQIPGIQSLEPATTSSRPLPRSAVCSQG